MSNVIYPTAEDLDTEGVHSDYTRVLYLIPSLESNSGKPEITWNGGVGNIGTPMPAWKKRWMGIGSYGANVIGESVLGILLQLEDKILTADAAYLGAEWDGRNTVGRWDFDLGDDFILEVAWDALSSGSCHDALLQTYWDADEYYRECSWSDLCECAKIDPERVLDDNWESLIEEVTKCLIEVETESVANTRAYVVWAAKQHREEQLED